MYKHTFHPGDVVKRLDERSDQREFKVVGESKHYPGMVICQPATVSGINVPFWPQNLTLVRAASEGES